MSALPGFTLEAFIRWRHHIVVENQPDSNFQLRLQEMQGISKIRRLHINQAEFKPLVAVYEPLRRFVETRLDHYDAEKQAWEDYAQVEFEPADQYTKQVDSMVNDLWNQQSRAAVNAPVPYSHPVQHKDQSYVHPSTPRSTISTSGWIQSV